MATTQLEIWVRVNEYGDYDCAPTRDTAAERFDDSIGNETETGYRMVRLLVTVPLPEPIEIVGEVTVEERPGTIASAPTRIDQSDIPL